LSNLERWGLVSGLRIATAAKSAKQKKVVRQGKKFYQTNQAFPLLRELRDLVLKSWLLLERNLAKRLDKIGRIRLLILSGRFVGQTAQESQIPTTDIFIVGSVNRDKLKSLVSSISRSFGEDIRYTVMSTKEYKFRKDITDKFIYAILEGRHIKVIDRFSRGKQPSE
jgi:hypothetical protein